MPQATIIPQGLGSYFDWANYQIYLKNFCNPFGGDVIMFPNRT